MKQRKCPSKGTERGKCLVDGDKSQATWQQGRVHADGILILYISWVGREVQRLPTTLLLKVCSRGSARVSPVSVLGMQSSGPALDLLN